MEENHSPAEQKLVDARQRLLPVVVDVGEVVLNHKDDVDMNAEEWMALKQAVALLLDARDLLDVALEDFLPDRED